MKKVFFVSGKGVDYVVSWTTCKIIQQGSLKHLKQWVKDNNYVLVDIKEGK